MMDTLINNFLKHRHHLSKLEKDVLEFIVSNPKKIADSTLDELSAELYISTATISRTAKQLGYKGYQELRYALNQYTQFEKGQDLSKEKWSSVDTYAESLIKQIRQTANAVNQAPIDTLLNLIHQAEAIELFGVGGSLPNCINAARKLVFLGKKANARIDWDELSAISQNLTPSDLAILISNSGETLHVIEYATNLANQCVPTIAIIGRPNSTLETLVTHTIQTDMQLDYVGDIDLSSRVALSFVLDSLLLNYAEHIHPNL